MIRLTPAVASAIEVDALDGRDDEHDPLSYAVLRAHFVAPERAGEPAFLREPATRADALALVDALVELSNSHDDIIEQRTTSADDKRFARAVCKQISTTIGRVRR